MKKFNFLFSILLLSICINAQNQNFAPINDTITVDKWEDAMELTFGLLNKSTYPSGYLFNKATPYNKMGYANGLLNDSSFNVLEFYFLQNFIRMSYNKPDSIIGYIKLDSVKNKFIEQENILPFGMVDILGQNIKQTAFENGYLTINNHRFIQNTNDPNLLFENKRLFSIVPLNIEVNTMNPQFILRSNEVFSNATASIVALDVDLDDGIGFKPIYLNVPFQANYSTDGYKQFLSRIIYSNGDTLYSRSELKINNPNIIQTLSNTWQYYDDIYDVYGDGNLHSNGFGNFPVGEFTGMTYDNEQNETYAQVGVWYAYCNIHKKLRKPYIIFAGYNPRDGKSLQASGVTPWINQTAGALNPFGWLDGWRGPLYETYNGFFTDFSKNANGGQSFGDNGARLLDKLRQEGYDVCIVRFRPGIGYLQTNAYLASLVLKEINYKILNDYYGYNVEDAGAALDPEAPGYPNSTKKKKAKHELVIGGYSAGVLTGRLALTLMEYEHKVRNQCDFASAWKSTHHRTKIWVGVDHECQGSNTPIGMQMFWDFQKSIWYLPANPADILNSLISYGADKILNENGIATQNTLYHISNTYDIGSNTWSSKPNNDFVNYYNDLTHVTLNTNPVNLKGYPIFPYRISISQGSAKGIPQVISNETNILYNESPTNICINPLGTLFSVGSGWLNWAINVSPYREATARVISSWNNEAFYCKVGSSIRTLFASWQINFGHWKYYTHNYVNDWWLGGPAKNYDEAAASSLPSNLIFAKSMAFSSETYGWASVLLCNLAQYSKKHIGFAPTVSGLDLHLPGNNNLPRFPNLSLIPGNTSGGLNLMQRNKYNGVFDPSPFSNFGYPHLTFPNNHYDYTPYDAIWANTTNNTNYDDNTMHVEDPNPLIGEFLTEELAPHTLYLSNRLIQDQMVYCSEGVTFRQKYYADFEARNSILAGDQSIYEHEQTDYERVRTSQGDFVVGDGAVVTFHANNYNGQSKITLGAGFSSKHGSIFRAYLYKDPNLCQPFSYETARTMPQKPEFQNKNTSRPIFTKRATSVKTDAKQNQKINVVLYPNPTTGELVYVMSEGAEYDYTITNSLGQVVQLGKLTKNVNQLNIKSLPKGVYLITIHSKTYLQTDRIILQ